MTSIALICSIGKLSITMVRKKLINIVEMKLDLNRRNNLAQPLKKKYETVVFWGYSVGATVAWLCSEYDGIGDAAIGYYGSRIRDYTDLRPKMSVRLLFAEQEASVDVHQLTERLSCTSGVNIERGEGAHGFANPFSRFYHPETEKRALDWSFKFIETIWTGEK